MNTESIRMLDCDGHVIESMSELAEYGDASIRWLAPGQKTSDGSRFPPLTVFTGTTIKEWKVT